MNVRSKLKDEPGFQYVVDAVETMSPVGQRMLMEQQWLCSAEAIEREHDNIDMALRLLPTRAFTTVRHQLMQLRDLSGTFRSLHSHVLLNEVELFEIKRFAQITLAAHKALQESGEWRVESGEKATANNDLRSNSTLHSPLSTLMEAFDLLDPDGTGMAHFYIYDSYDARLAPLRKALKASGGEDADLFAQMQEVEKEVLARLSDQLVPFAPMLTQALNQMGYLDLLLAKAVLTNQWHLTRPTIHSSLSTLSNTLHALFNPRLKAHCEAQGLRYQPVDISLREGVCLITGANMAGKTVLLKTVGIAQMMLQFGLFVPAQEAEMTLVDDVLFCIGDEQNEMNGLSSFASEIIKISDAVSRAEQQRLLILIDEPARTTNPLEGKAIVQSLATLLQGQHSLSLITTHYSQLGLDCRRLRVRGFVETLSDQPLTPQNINRFMDYSLLEDNSDDVPQEALRIASILGCHPRLLDTARSFIESD